MNELEKDVLIDPIGSETEIPAPALPAATQQQAEPRQKRKYTRKKKEVEVVAAEPKTLRVKTKKGFPINLHKVNIIVRPGVIQPVPDDPYVHRQIQLGSIELVDD